MKQGREAIVHALAAGVLLALLAACQSDPSPPSPPDAGPDAGVAPHPTPGPGQAAAWQVTDPADLIPGPSTHGRTGDWMLANGRVRFLVEGAHASDGYDPYGGSVLAADRQRASGGESRWGEIWIGLNFRAPGCDKVELVSDGSGGEPAELRVTGHDAESPFMASLFDQTTQPPSLQMTIERHYLLAPDGDVLQVNLVLRNDGDQPLALREDYVGMAMNRGLRHWVPVSGFAFDVLNQINPSAEFYAATGDRVSYSLLNLDAPFSPILDFAKVLIGQYPQITIGAGQARAFRFAIAVGTGDVGSLQLAHAALRGPLDDTARLSGTVVDAAGAPIAGARVHVSPAGDATSEVSYCRTAADGTWAAALRPGDYQLRAVADDRKAGAATAVTLPPAGLTTVKLALAGSATLVVSAKEAGLAIPVKIVAEPVVGNERAAFPAADGEPWARQPIVVFAETGKATIPVYPGKWQVTVSRGFEYDLGVQVVDASAGSGSYDAVLHRVVDTTGWLSGDFHVHAQFSPDADDLLAAKVRAFAGEGLEVPVSTEHEFVGDFAPAVQALGLGAFMHAVGGTELTTTSIGHFNIFPLAADPAALNHGALNWYGRPLPDVIAEARRRVQPGGLVPFVQLNHPRTLGMDYFGAVRFEPAFFGPGANTQHYMDNWDAMEVWNGVPLGQFEGCPPAPTTCKSVSHPTAYDWFSFLSHGRRVTGTGNSDSHTASLNAVGYPRNYVQVGSDDPAALTDAALLAGLRAGKVSISGGPFLQLTAQAGAGNWVGPGGTAIGEAAAGGYAVHLKVDVQAPTWMGPLSRVDVWTGDNTNLSQPGKVVATLDLTQGAYRDDGTKVHRLDHVAVDLVVAKDTWVLATVRGPVRADGTSGALWPVVQTPQPPFAITNPIWVDANADGVVSPLIP